MSKWISIKDKFPEFSGPCLVTNAERLSMPQVAHFSEPTKDFGPEGEFFSAKNFFPLKVTHWLEIPNWMIL